MELVFVLNGGKYGGVELSVDGTPYEVRHEGSRDVVNVPDKVAHLLEGHGWSPTGVATARMVEIAVNAEKAASDERKRARIQELLDLGVPMNQIMLHGVDRLTAMMTPGADAGNAALQQRIDALEAKLAEATGAKKVKKNGEADQPAA